MAQPPSPCFVLKRSGEAVMDLEFWDTGCYEQGTTSSYIIAGYSNQGGLHVWSLNSRRVVAHYPSECGILSVYGTKHAEIVSLNREGGLKLIDAKSGLCKWCIAVPNVGFCKASCHSSNENILVAVTGEAVSSIAVWNLPKKTLEWRLLPGADFRLGMVMCTKLLEDASEKLISVGGYEDGSLVLWDVEKETMIHVLSLYDNEPIMCFDFTSEMMCGVAGSPTEVLTKFSISINESENYLINIEKKRSIKNSGIADIKIRGDCRIVAAGGWRDGTVRIFTLKTLKPLAVLQYHDGTVQSIAFKSDFYTDKQILASGSETHKIAIWNIYND